MEWLLGKKEVRKVALVSYFYETNQTKMLIPELERHFNWSTYMIKSLINELLHDQKRFGIPEQGRLRLSPSEREVELIPGNRAYLLSLTANYIKESYLFRTLVVGMTNNPTALSVLAENLKVPKLHLKNDIHQFNDRARTANIEINTYNRLQGDEWAIRIMLVSIFKNVIHDEIELAEFFAPDIIRQANQVARFYQMSNVEAGHLTDHQHLSLMIELAVWLVRLNARCAISSSDQYKLLLPDDQLDDAYRNLLGLNESVIRRFVRLPPHELSLESRYGVIMFVRVGISDGHLSRHASPEVAKVHSMLTTIAQTVYREFFGQDMPQDLSTQLTRQLELPTMRLLFLTHINYQGNDDYTINHSLFPEYALFTDRFLTRVNEYLGIKTLNIKNRMFRMFYNLFIGILDRQVMIPQLQVSLRIRDTFMHEEVAAMLMRQADLRVDVSDELGQCDMVISATLLPHTDDTRVIVWTTLPTFAEFDSFLHTAVNLTMDKFTKSIYERAN
ncbi:helix-turn-helix domain-containing protein [Weissella confusa]|uniref:helix-turn-helix domain-containing protein n=1 Tax=Weissella confusa TaxID=1583 RepID=UPI00376EEB7C